MPADPAISIQVRSLSFMSSRLNIYGTQLKINTIQG
jgi:hypothetical protein